MKIANAETFMHDASLPRIMQLVQISHVEPWIQLSHQVGHNPGKEDTSPRICSESLWLTRAIPSFEPRKIK